MNSKMDNRLGSMRGNGGGRATKRNEKERLRRMGDLHNDGVCECEMKVWKNGGYIK